MKYHVCIEIAAFIEKNTWAGLEEFFLNLAQALHNECEGQSLKSKLSSKHTSGRMDRKRKDNFNDRRNFGISQNITEGNSQEENQTFLIDTEESDSIQMLSKMRQSKGMFTSFIKK